MAELRAEFRRTVWILGGALALMWALLAIDTLLGHRLLVFGIRPRSVQGLVGILCAPFLHGGLLHLSANSGGFVMLGWLVMAREIRDFVVVSLYGVFLGGAGVWFIGAPNSVHVGASGVIFAYFGHLVATGWYERKLMPVLLSLGVFVGYGGMLFGVLPGTPGISWEGHLFGLLSGVLAAKHLARSRARDPR